MRIPFLVLTLACVFLGGSIAVNAQLPISLVDWLLVLLGAISAHVSVNALNEYFDFRSGLDATTIRTPFSGGSGALIENPGAVYFVLITAIAALCITVLIGMYFVYLHGTAILPIGLTGILIILAYTPLITRHPFLCLISPGLAFGPLMVVGTYFVLTGEYSIPALYISLVPFFLVNNLLLLNQYPDIRADRAVGRNHFPIAFGTRISTLVYSLFVALTALVIVVGILLELLPRSSYLALLPLTAAFVIVPGVMRNEGTIEKLSPFLGLNVMMTLVTPVMLAISLLMS